MAGRKPQWPELGDLAIATIEMVDEYGAYAKLDEIRQTRIFARFRDFFIME